jgi:Protein of unknown function (DUF4242)
MAVYLVERNLPGVKMEQLAAAQKAAIATSESMTREGKQVRYIRSTFVPSDHRCMCLFEASNEKDVEEVNRKANIPFTRITEAMDLTPQS